MSALKKLAGQTAIYGLPSIIGRVLNYLLVPLHTILFTTSAYGVQNYFYAVAGFLAVVLTYGMETAFFRFFTKESNNKRVFSTTQISILTTSVIFLLCIIPFANSIADFIGFSGRQRDVIWWAVILAADAVCAVPFALLRMQNKAIKFASIKFLWIVLNILLNLFFLLLLPYIASSYILPSALSWMYIPSWNIEYVFLANLIASIIVLLTLLPIILKLRAGFDFGLWRRMFKYALPLLFLGMAGIINETFDRILLKYMLPADIADSQIGIYGACYKIAVLMSIFIQAYKYAAEPFFFSYVKEKDSRKTFASLMNYFVITLSLLFLATVLNLDIIVHFIGKDFREGREVIPILLMAYIFLGIFYNLSIWYKLSDRTIWGAVISIMGAFITIVLNIILIPVYGYMGSAYATFACYLTMMIITYLLGRKYYPIPYDLRKFLLYLTTSIVIYFITNAINIENEYTRFFFNNSFIILYVIMAIRVEKIKLRPRETP